MSGDSVQSQWKLNVQEDSPDPTPISPMKV